MKITVEFDSLQEVNDFCDGILVAPGFAQAARDERKAADEAPKKAEAKKSSPKKEKAQEEAKTEAEEAPAEDEERYALTEKGKAIVQEPEKDARKEAAHTESDLKLLLSGKLKAGKKAEVKELFTKYGVSCLTDLIEKEKENIDAIYAEAEVI